MKRNFIKAFVIVSMLALLCTACADSNKEAPDNSTNATQATQVSDFTESTEATTQPPTEEVTEATTEADESAELKIVEELYSHVWAHSGVAVYDNSMNDVDKLSDKYLGAISSEEDAVEKGQAALIELYGRKESDYEYVAEYKEEYGVWVVKSVFPPGRTDENGVSYGYVGTKPYIVIRESDGKALGTFSG
ncbi:MAG: hypothetical protein UD936_02235 [Acutalibacteraceae bacterium]|nr:hypothetical protein [Acutalibacteraceae bacterium]